jgi:hypothetical protein
MSETVGEIEVLEIFEEIRQAMLKNDTEPLEEHVAEDYQGCDAGGRLHGRDLFLEAYGPGGVDLEAFEASEVETTSWSDTVLVRGSASIRGRYGEFDFDHTLRFLDVYARREGGWQLIASHVCDILPE